MFRTLLKLLQFLTDSDIITEYAFARNNNQLGSLHLQTGFKDVDRSGARFRHLVKQMPWLMRIIKVLPGGMLARINPELKTLSALFKVGAQSGSCYPNTTANILCPRKYTNKYQKSMPVGRSRKQTLAQRRLYFTTFCIVVFPSTKKFLGVCIKMAEP